MEIIVPPGMLGASDADTALDVMLRAIAVAIPGGDWAEKYGADWEDDVFLMHRYCGCEREGECPWCTGCRVYQERNACQVCQDQSLTPEQRRQQPPERRCDYSVGRGIFARFAPYTLNHERPYYDPPNFWFKPTNLRVRWYRYIGRDVETNRDFSANELVDIYRTCAETVRA